MDAGEFSNGVWGFYVQKCDPGVRDASLPLSLVSEPMLDHSPSPLLVSETRSKKMAGSPKTYGLRSAYSELFRPWDK